MRRALGLLFAVVVAVLSVRCGGAPSPSSATSAGRSAAGPWWLAASNSSASGVLTSSAVDGFRVHPDPDGDGVVHAFEGENVVVNAADVASRPPAPQTYLIVNWGDDGLNNQRVGCGPCRLEHGYSVGRYTLVATADDLQPAAVASSTNRSISLVVEVSRAPSAPFQPFEFVPRDIGVGETALLRIPFFLPEGVTLTGVFLNCSPFNAATISFFAPISPPIAEIPFTGNVPGTCTFGVAGTDGAGTPFRQNAKLTIH